MRQPVPSASRARLPASQVGQVGWAFLLAGLALLAYLPALKGGFIWDDDAHVTANPCIVGPLGLKEIWTSGDADYFPLTLTSFWAQHALWGLNPWPYHAVTVLFHALCAVLFWRVLLRLGVPGAWLGAALWALHPVQAESVAWISELKNTQSCLFYLGAALFFLRWLGPGDGAERKGSGWHYALSLLCAVLAIVSKSSTVMLPAALGLVWWWRRGKFGWRDARWLTPFLAVSGLAGAYTILEQRFHSGAMGPEWTLSWAERFAISGKDVWFYLGKLTWPHPLIFIYPRWETGPVHPAAFVPLAAMVGVFVLLWRRRTGALRPVFVAAVYFWFLLFPVLGFFAVYFFRYSYVGDHFQYLASMGPLALAGAAIARCGTLGPISPSRRSILGGALLLALGVLTWRQCSQFRNEQTLWRETLVRNPGCWMADVNLAAIVASEGHFPEALARLEDALRLEPDSAEANSSMGRLLAIVPGRLPEAIVHFETALRFRPDSAATHCDLGCALERTPGRSAEAVVQFEEALRLKPNFSTARYNMETAFARIPGRLAEAIAQDEEALRLAPNSAERHCILGDALMGMPDRVPEATAHFQEAERLDPKFPEAHYDLGNVLQRAGRLPEAIAEYEAALRLNHGYAQAHDNLGTILARIPGRSSEAIAHYRAALIVDPDSIGAHFNLGVSLMSQPGGREEAMKQFEQVLLISPDLAEARELLEKLKAKVPGQS